MSSNANDIELVLTRIAIDENEVHKEILEVDQEKEEENVEHRETQSSHIEAIRPLQQLDNVRPPKASSSQV